MQRKVVMHTDGGSRGNPGPAAVGVWISVLDGEAVDRRFGECIGIKTNNEAEYEALVFGLKKIKSIIGKSKAKQTSVECYLDSELVVHQLNHKYKLLEEHIQKLFILIWNLTLDFEQVSFAHVRREKNIIADAMVNKALDNQCKQKKLL